MNRSCLRLWVHVISAPLNLERVRGQQEGRLALKGGFISHTTSS